MNKKPLTGLTLTWLAWGLLAAFILFASGYAVGQRSQSGGYTIKTQKTAADPAVQTAAPSVTMQPSAAPAPSFDPNAPIDINRATAAELEDLPGIGPALAARIAESRETDGPFANVDDLERVSGIGPATVAKLRPYATCQPASK